MSQSETISNPLPIVLLATGFQVIIAATLVAICWGTIQAPPAAVNAIPEQERFLSAEAGHGRNGEVVVSGRVEAMPGARKLAAPLSGAEVLGYTARVERYHTVVVGSGKNRRRERALLARNLVMVDQVPMVVHAAIGDVVVAGQLFQWYSPGFAAVRHDKWDAAPAWAVQAPGFKGPGVVTDDSWFEGEEVVVHPGDEISVLGVVKDVDGRKQVQSRGGLLTTYLRPPNQLKSRLAAAQVESDQGKAFAWIGLIVSGFFCVPWLFVIWFARSRRGAPQAL